VLELSLSQTTLNPFYPYEPKLNNFEYRIEFLFPLFEQPNTYMQRRKHETQIKYTIRMQSPHYICTHERKTNTKLAAYIIMFEGTSSKVVPMWINV